MLIIRGGINSKKRELCPTALALSAFYYNKNKHADTYIMYLHAYSTSLHWYKHQYCYTVDCILQILFSSYLISLLINKSSVTKIRSISISSPCQFYFVLYCFIWFFLVSAAASVGTEQMSTGHLVPLYFPLSEFVSTGRTI